MYSKKKSQCDGCFDYQKNIKNDNFTLKVLLKWTYAVNIAFGEWTKKSSGLILPYLDK